MMYYTFVLYLQRQGWQLFEEHIGADLWLSPQGDELWVTQNLVEAMQELAQLEGRSVEALFCELQGRPQAMAA